VAFSGSQDRVVDVEGVLQAFDDGKVDGVRSSGRRVLFGELVEESNEYGMPLDLSLKRLGGIESGQVGDPLAHRRAGLAHCVRPDRVTGGAFPGSVHAGEDEDVAQLGLMVFESLEGRVLAMLGAEFFPLAPDGTFAGVGESCGRFACFLERRHEMSFAFASDSRWSRRQGLLCG